jgi:hypothetical protein
VRLASLEDAEPICAIYGAAIVERGSTFEIKLRSAGAGWRRAVPAAGGRRGRGRHRLGGPFFGSKERPGVVAALPLVAFRAAPD